jgi:hypothetical protein
MADIANPLANPDGFSSDIHRLPGFRYAQSGLHAVCALANNQRRRIFRYGGKKRSLCRAILDYPSRMSSIAIGGLATQTRKGIQMSKTEDNKAIVGRWFTEFWGKTCNLGVVDELAAPDMLLQYSLHEPRCGRDDIKAFMTDFRQGRAPLGRGGSCICGNDRARKITERASPRWEFSHIANSAR